MSVVGTFSVSSSDDPRFVAGSSYPLTIESGVELDVTTVTSVTATVPPAPTPTTPTPSSSTSSPSDSTSAPENPNSTPPATP